MDDEHYQPFEIGCDGPLEAFNDDPIEVDDEETLGDADHLEHPFVYQQRHPPLIIHPPLSFSLPDNTASPGVSTSQNSSESSRPADVTYKEFHTGPLEADSNEEGDFSSEVAIERCQALMTSARRRLRSNVPTPGRIHRIPQIRKSKIRLRQVNSAPSSIRSEHLVNENRRTRSSEHNNRLAPPHNTESSRSASMDGRRRHRSREKAHRPKTPPTKTDGACSAMEWSGYTPPPRTSPKMAPDSPMDWSRPTE